MTLELARRYDDEYAKMNHLEGEYKEGKIDTEKAVTIMGIHNLKDKNLGGSLKLVGLLSQPYRGEVAAQCMEQFKPCEVIEDGTVAHKERPPQSKMVGETIYCPDYETNITREECLDFSGCAANAESCSDCMQYKLTRELLLKNM
jgi:hypothetical protein